MAGSALSDVNGRGLLSARPSAGRAGREYFATDTLISYRDNGSTWDAQSAAAAAGGTPALVFGSAAAAGSAGTFVRTDDTLALFDATAPSTQAFGNSAAVGTAGKAARRDHKHGFPAGLADHSAFSYMDATNGSAPSAPASGYARIYAKSDGRIYSKDDGGTEYGPFDAAGGGGGGGGGGLYSVDDTFPGASGYTFTGAGSIGSGSGVEQITGGGQHDRYMRATPGSSQYLVRAHLKNVTGRGGMPSLVVLNSVGTGFGCGPYGDGNIYGWRVTTYAYAGTASGGGSFPTATDFWLDMFTINGTDCQVGYSLDGSTWVDLGVISGGPGSFTQLGICQIYTSANIYVELAELQICEP